MTTLILDSASLAATSVQTTEDTLIVELADGHSVSVPLGWYPRLIHATTVERENFRFIAGGEGIHWPDLDEDISVEVILAGRLSGESQASFRRWLDSRLRPKEAQ